MAWREAASPVTESDGAASESLPSPLRLRSAGFGVILGGLLLGMLSVGLPYDITAGVLVGLGTVGIVLARGDTVLVQVFLGIGAIGAIGLVEALTATGLGLGAPALASIAILFGAFDVFVGSLLHRYGLTGDQEDR